MIRKFEEKDHKLLDEWCKQYGWESFPKSTISPYSYVIEKEGQLIAFSQFYKAEGCGMCSLGQTIADKEADAIVRRKAVNELIDHVVAEAESVSDYMIYSTDRNALPIIRRLVQRGAVITDEADAYILFMGFDKKDVEFFKEGHE